MKIVDTIKQLNGRVYELTKADMDRKSVIGLKYIKASSINSTFEPLEKRSPVALAEDNMASYGANSLKSLWSSTTVDFF